MIGGIYQNNIDGYRNKNCNKYMNKDCKCQHTDENITCECGQCDFDYEWRGKDYFLTFAGLGLFCLFFCLGIGSCTHLSKDFNNTSDINNTNNTSLVNTNK